MNCIQPMFYAPGTPGTCSHKHSLSYQLRTPSKEHQTSLIRHGLLRLVYPLRGNLGQLIELLLSHLAHGTEQQHEQQLDALLGHHQDSLHEKALEQLWTDSLVQTEETVALEDKLHDFDEGLEGLSVTLWRGLALQADFGDDQGLGCDGG